MLIYDPEIQSTIQRFNYCEKFKVSPYAPNYGDQPCNWVDFCQILNGEIAAGAANG